MRNLPFLLALPLLALALVFSAFSCGGKNDNPTTPNGNANPINTATSTFTASQTPAFSATPSSTRTPTPTPTNTAGLTATSTPTCTFTLTDTPSRTASPSPTGTYTPAYTPTVAFTPTVTSTAIVSFLVSGASGTGGCYIANDVLTARCDLTQAVYSAQPSAVTIDFSSVGGTLTAAANAGGVWSASVAIPAGSIDATGLTLAVSIYKDSLLLDQRVSGPFACDNQPPLYLDSTNFIVSYQNTYSQAASLSCVGQPGQTLYVYWNYKPAAHPADNGDIASVKADLSQLEGTSDVIQLSKGSTVYSGSGAGLGAIPYTGLTIPVTAVDDAGNVTAYSLPVHVDTQPLAVSPISLTGRLGNNDFQNGDSVTITWIAGGPGAFADVASTSISYPPAISGPSSLQLNGDGNLQAVGFVYTAGILGTMPIGIAATNRCGNNYSGTANAILLSYVFTPSVPPTPAYTDTVTATPSPTPAPYRHTIVLDGVDDFVPAQEQFATTSLGYNAYVSWDAANLYFGYSGPDVGSNDANKWLLAYLDVDPGANTGAAVGKAFNTQQPSFPAGFRPDYLWMWKADNSWTYLMQYNTGTGVFENVGPETAYQTGTYLETAVALSAIGSPSQMSVNAFFVEAATGSEWTYGGLFSDDFNDGYNASPLHYLSVDFSSASPPNTPGNEKP